MTTASAIYEGTIRHRRFGVRPHELRHRLALMYLDLEELDGLLGGPARRRPARHWCASAGTTTSAIPPLPLAEAVRDAGRAARRASCPPGPIRLLTQLRTFGHCFNPVSFYYCFTAQEQLDAVVAEVTSTPWGERHAYVLGRTGEGPVLTAGFAKALHVSPFMGMEQRYTCARSRPARR